MAPTDTIMKIDRRLSVAPMMSWTDRHCRYFLRLIAPQALLYTVMITTGALVHGKKLEVLDYSAEEHPIALQLGGSEPDDLAHCAGLAEKYGYDEINLNCGCPSERVQKGSFGACLMAEPQLVADCIDAMKQKTNIPVTVKTRIGIDDRDDYGFLRDFIGKIADKGCTTFIIHARKAILKGLSPAENRTVPPLMWDRAYQLKKDFPDLEIILNGGIKTVADVKDALTHADGAMIGREAYHNPYMMAACAQEIFGAGTPLSREEVTLRLIPYIDARLVAGDKLHDITRHILGLYHGQPRAKRWRQILSSEAMKPGVDSWLLHRAMAVVAPESLENSA